MEKFKPAEKKSDLYDIGDGLILLNIQTKNVEGVLDRVDTYLGMDGNRVLFRGCGRENLFSRIYFQLPMFCTNAVRAGGRI